MIRFIINLILWLATLAALSYGGWYLDKAEETTDHIFRTELERDEAVIEYRNNDIHIFEYGFNSTLGDYPYYLKYNEEVTNSFVQKLNVIIIFGIIQPIRFTLAFLIFIGNKDSKPIKKLFLVSIEEL